MNAHVALNNKGLITKQKAWDSLGRPLKDYIYLREAAFDSLNFTWKDFLKKNLNIEVASDNYAPVNHEYRAVVEFIIDKTGNVSNVKIVKNPGYGTGEELQRVIKLSPKWIPGIYNNKPIISRRTQPIIFNVVGD